MTKTIVIGKEKTNTSLNPIKFDEVLCSSNCLSETDFVVTKSTMKPHVYRFVELICKDYSPGHDLMFAYNNENNRAIDSWLYIGHWNDGVTEPNARVDNWNDETNKKSKA